MTKKELKEFFSEDEQAEIIEGLEYHGIDLEQVENIFIHKNRDAVVDDYIETVGGCNSYLEAYIDYEMIFSDLESEGYYYNSYVGIIEYVLA
ncbi:MAG TPA: hypothetical protein ENG48_12795 [Candidatus Atribacteria bacterium]|nr:hypothetical protein [Candidatus Atribacteria bacterium]